MNVEMKYLVRGFIRWLMLIGIGLNLIVWTAIIARCQHRTLHTDQDEWESSIRVKIVTATSRDDNLVYWKKNKKLEIVMSSFGYDKDTRFSDFEIGKCYQVFYCEKHLMSYIWDRIDKKYCGG